MRNSEHGVFAAGDRVQLTGPKNKLHTITLQAGGVFHSHKGPLAHDDIIGQPDGSVLRNAAGIEYLALRPRLADLVMSMPRGAAIIYPKDAAQILALADIAPHSVIVEAGVGSGALSLWILRALSGTGQLFSFERREEFAQIARGNVASIFGDVPENWSLTVGELSESLERQHQPASVDRVVLDMLAPWECLASVSRVLRPGGILLCYVATVTQLSRVTEAIRASGGYTSPESTETLVRGWHVEGLAVRPDHRMIAHTGFLLVTRRLAPGSVLPELKRRPSKSDYADDDLEAWTPGALGERQPSAKQLGRRVRQASAQADGASERHRLG